jgi:hypothetical protein
MERVRDDAVAVRKTSSVSMPGIAAALGLLAAVGLAAFPPARWRAYEALLVVPDLEGVLADPGATPRRAPGIERRFDARNGSWIYTARAATREGAEAELAAVAADLLARGASAEPAAPELMPWVGPAPPLTPAAATAAELLAEAQLASEAAWALGPAPVVTLPAASTVQLRLRGALATLDADLRAAVRDRDPRRVSELGQVIAATEVAWARQWVRPAAGEAGTRDALARARALLRVRWMRRAREMRAEAVRLLGASDRGERARALSAAQWRARDLMALRPGLRGLGRAAALSPWIADARPLLLPRAIAGLAAGALVAAAVLGVGWLGARFGRRGVPTQKRLTRGVAGLSPFQARLHWVAGPTPGCVAAACYELATRSTEHGERVLVVDAGERLQLHRVVGRERNWGLTECVREGLPLLGVVQDTGVERLHLLARGERGPLPGWTELARSLAQARPHFDRVIVGLDPGKRPRPPADLAAGASWWWAHPPGGPARAPKWLGDSIGNAVNAIPIEGPPEVALEVVRQAAPSSLTPVAAVRAEPLESPRPTLPAPVLDCDLQVQERLRFLTWLRRMQTESRAPAQPVEDGVASTT